MNAADTGDARTSGPPLLELRDVTVRRGSVDALDGLSLTIAEGEHVAIVGPNGCGKSTLIKTLTRECYPLPGPGTALRIRGRDRWDVFALRRTLGIISNDLTSAFVYGSTVLEVVLSGFFASLVITPHHRVDALMLEHATNALELLEIDDLAERRFDELSSGQARRAVIARALVSQPRTLLFDEPTVSLDIRAQREVVATMRRLAAAGIGLLLVTHDISEIVPEIERVLFLHAGALAGDGAKADMLTSERLSALFRTPLEVTATGGWYDVLRSSPDGLQPIATAQNA